MKSGVGRRRALATWGPCLATSTAVLLLSACSHYAGLRELPPPPPLPSSAPTTAAPPDYSKTNLAAVAGRSTTTILIDGGSATLGGSVNGPEGGVGGAVVHIERLVGDGLAAKDVLTNPDGTWQAPAVRGGRYRVRAFRAPDLALTDPQVFFLGGAENKVLLLALARFTGTTVRAAVAPRPPVIDVPAQLVVAVTIQSVDAQGIVRGAPVVGADVDIVLPADWALSSTNPRITDTRGQVSYQFTCTLLGSGGVSATVGFPDGTSQSYPLDLPPCSLPPPTTTIPPTTTTTVATTLLGTTTTAGGRPTTTRRATTTTSGP